VWPEQAAAAAAAGSHARRMGQLVGLGLGLMAKVADFGLSLTLGPADTHVSQMHMVSAVCCLELSGTRDSAVDTRSLEAA
jgi:hypothetical protein